MECCPLLPTCLSLVILLRLRHTRIKSRLTIAVADRKTLENWSGGEEWEGGGGGGAKLPSLTNMLATGSKGAAYIAVSCMYICVRRGTGHYYSALEKQIMLTIFSCFHSTCTFKMHCVHSAGTYENSVSVRNLMYKLIA